MIRFWSVLRIVIVASLGCLNHFLYEWSGKNFFVGLFTPVNESVWEHIKLLFFPFLICMIIEYFMYGHEKRGFIFSSTSGLLAGLIFIPAAFYTYTGIVGKEYFIVDILIFFLSVIISFRLGRFKEGNFTKDFSAFIILLCLTVLFAGFTVYPPDSPLFISAA